MQSDCVFTRNMYVHCTDTSINNNFDYLLLSMCCDQLHQNTIWFQKFHRYFRSFSLFVWLHFSLCVYVCLSYFRSDAFHLLKSHSLVLTDKSFCFWKLKPWISLKSRTYLVFMSLMKWARRTFNWFGRLLWMTETESENANTQTNEQTNESERERELENARTTYTEVKLRESGKRIIDARIPNKSNKFDFTRKLHFKYHFLSASFLMPFLKEIGHFQLYLNCTRERER